MQKKVPDSSECVPDSSETDAEVSNNTELEPDTARLSKQEYQIVEYLKEKIEISAKEAGVLLSVSDRRARTILKNMTEKKILRKEGVTNGAAYSLADNIKLSEKFG